MSIDEIKNSKAEFLRLEDICGSVLPCSARTLRQQIKRHDSGALPFIQLGERYFIPRQQLLKYLEKGSGSVNSG